MLYRILNSPLSIVERVFHVDALNSADTTRNARIVEHGAMAAESKSASPSAAISGEQRSSEVGFARGRFVVFFRQLLVSLDENACRMNRSRECLDQGYLDPAFYLLALDQLTTHLNCSSSVFHEF
jgi:hypothetical protein